MFLMRYRTTCTGITLLILLSLFSLTGNVQSQPVQLSISVPSDVRELYEDTLIPRFEDVHPNINVTVESAIQPQMRPSSVQNINDYLEALEIAASRADLFPVDAYTIGATASATGYLLDIAPLIATDSNFNENAFYPAARNAFAWGGQTWAMPVAVTPLGISWNREAFDDAGLSPPQPDWTAADYASAAEALARRSADGGIIQPGILLGGVDTPTFLRAVSGEPLHQNGAPNLTNPALEDAVAQWGALVEQGIVGTNPADFQGGINSVALRVNRSGFINPGITGLTYLPGQQAAIDATGFAISSGTDAPQAAYSLLTFLTQQPEAVQMMTGALPVRRDVVLPESEAGLPGSIQQYRQNALEIAFPPSDTLYGHLLNLSAFREGNAAQVLQSATDTAQQLMQQASEQAVAIGVVAPQPTPVPESDEVILDFIIARGGDMFPSVSTWEDFADEYVASIPGIDGIEITRLRPTIDNDPAPRINEADCAYGIPYDDIPRLALNPLLSADPTFDEADLIGDPFQFVTDDNGDITALPFFMTAEFMFYNPDIFEETGVPVPDNDWTYNDFVTTLEALTEATGRPEFFDRMRNGRGIEMLAIAAGEPVYLYDTDPVTIRYTDEAVISNLRQILDLAKNDSWDYVEQAVMFGSLETPSQSRALITLHFSVFDLIANTVYTKGDTYEPLMFPQSEAYAPVAYWPQFVYITENSRYPEACYSWLRAVTQNPALHRQMPAYHSVLEQPVAEDLYSPQAMETMRAFAHRLSQDNVIRVGQSLDADTSRYGTMFARRAYDRYVYEDADLAQQMSLAEQYYIEFDSCVDNRLSSGAVDDYEFPTSRAIYECFVQIDPEMCDVFPQRSSSSREDLCGDDS